MFQNSFYSYKKYKHYPIKVLKTIKKEPNDGQSRRYNITSQFVKGPFFVKNCDEFEKERKPKTAKKTTIFTTTITAMVKTVAATTDNPMSDSHSGTAIKSSHHVNNLIMLITLRHIF